MTVFDKRLMAKKSSILKSCNRPIPLPIEPHVDVIVLIDRPQVALRLRLGNDLDQQVRIAARVLLPLEREPRTAVIAGQGGVDVAPGLVEDSAAALGDYFPGQTPVSMDRVGAGYVSSVEGSATGELIRIYE